MLASPKLVNHFLADYGPPLLDPFCGGGSIPLEAQRLGLRAYAADLNPVAVLITKALVEIPPKFAGMPPVNPEWQRKSREQKTATVWKGARGLAEDVRYYGKWMRDEAKKRIGYLYPTAKITKEVAKDRPDLKGYLGRDLTVVAWLWARTIVCPNPACRARAPMLRSFWLCRKKGKEVVLQPHIRQSRKTVHFSIARSTTVPKETSNRTGARCLYCQTVIKKPQLRETASTNGLTTIPLAAVCDGGKERLYVPFTRTRAVAAVNTALVGIYSDIGRHISRRATDEESGCATVESVAEAIHDRYPAMRGHSGPQPLADEAILRDLANQPVIQSQSRNPLKIGRVVGHEGQAVLQSDGGDHQVCRGHGYALLQQRPPDLTELLRTERIEIQYLDFLTQVGNQRQQPTCLRVPVGPGVQLGQRDAGDSQLAGILNKPVRQDRRTPHVGGTDVRVEQEVHRSSNCGASGR